MVVKAKYKLNIIDSSKKIDYYLKEDTAVLNLNSCINKPTNLNTFEALIKEINSLNIKKINLCNLASLCYRINIDYASEKTLDLMINIISILDKYNCKVCQNKINNYNEIDLKPFDNLVKIDYIGGIIYTYPMVINITKIMGYLDNQLIDIFSNIDSLEAFLPEDMIHTLPIESEQNNLFYLDLKELLC